MTETNGPTTATPPTNIKVKQERRDAQDHHRRKAIKHLNKAAKHLRKLDGIKDAYVV